MSRPFISLSFLLAAVVVTTGCGDKQMAHVHGKVSFNGQPVTVGTLVFSPIASGDDHKPGKSSTGDIQPDGTYQLSTFRAHDGALIGRHIVRFVPSIDHKKANVVPQTSVNFAELALPADYSAEVKSGSSNEINVELIKGSPH